MPPRRRIARQTQLQPQQSDYETDAANLTDNNQQQQQYSLDMSFLPQRSAEELNMLVLRRWYPSISTILAIAPFATLYVYPPESQVWTKCDTEGVLFIVELQPEQGSSFPRFRVIILNRKSMENFELDLTTTDNIEITDEYVIVQVPDAEGHEQIYGIWIFSDNSTVPDTRQVVAGTIMECARRAEEYAESEAMAQEGATQHTFAAAYEPPNEATPSQPALQQDRTAILSQHRAIAFGSQAADSSDMFRPGGGHPNGNFQEIRTPQNQYGQQVDLSTFFQRPQTQADSYQQPTRTDQVPFEQSWQPSAVAPSHAHPPQSHTSAEHASFYHPQPMPANHPMAHSQQSNSLLDLFKNASKLS